MPHLTANNKKRRSTGRSGDYTTTTFGLILVVALISVGVLMAMGRLTIGERQLSEAQDFVPQECLETIDFNLSVLEEAVERSPWCFAEYTGWFGNGNLLLRPANDDFDSKMFGRDSLAANMCRQYPYLFQISEDNKSIEFLETHAFLANHIVVPAKLIAILLEEGSLQYDEDTSANQ